MSTRVTIEARLRWPDVRDDYVLYYQEHSIGRARRDLTGWVWSIVVPMALPDWAEGVAASRDDAFKALASAWGRLLAATSPERLQRAWDLEKGFEARAQNAASLTADAP
jgi:hypothetical protein